MVVLTRPNRIVSSVLIGILILFICMFDVTPVSAAIIIVNTTNDKEIDDGLCSVREAIFAATLDTAYLGCPAGSPGVDRIILPDEVIIVEDSLSINNAEIEIVGESRTRTVIQAKNCNPVTDTCTHDFILFVVGTHGDLTLDNLTVRFAQAMGAIGGAISNNGTLDITNCVFTANRSQRGGAVANFGILSVTDSTFSSNTVGDYTGGAIYNGSSSIALIESSTFTGNSALNSGAIKNEGTLFATNSTFSGNEASLGSGGAIANLSIANINHSTFSDNGASHGGAGIYNGSTSTLDLSNTIIANSITGSDCRNMGTIGTNNNNLIEDGSCDADYSGDPLLGPLASNGGPTQTCALLPGSLAVDNGYTEVGWPPTDQRGIVRPQGVGTDIGAYEMEYISFYIPFVINP